MTYRFTLLIAMVLCSFLAGATHIIGGHIEVEQVGSDQYQIELTILRDCGDGNSDLRSQYAIRVFRLSDSSFTTHTFALGAPQKIEIGDPCFSPPDLCIEEYKVTGTISLSSDSLGYMFVAQEFARNYQIANIYAGQSNQAGMTWVTEFPSPGQANTNTSPHLQPITSNNFLCIDYLREIDLSATDPDGDSLSYHLETPYNSKAGANNNSVQPLPGPPPYNPVNWRPGYSLNTVISGNPPLSLDPVTGKLKVRPDQFGVYVVTYAVREYRNGVKIGEVRRDFQLEVLSCEINEPPTLTQPADKNFRISVKEEICIPVVIRDGNPDDTISVSSNYELAIDNLNDNPELRLMTKTDTGTVTGQLCWKPSCEESLGQQKLQFRVDAISYGCDATDTISDTFNIEIEPLPKKIENLLPNMFTPNHDGINDVYRLQNELTYPCLSELEIRIFNRWGTEVYHNTLSDRFGWDGQYQGQEAAQGVYYYVISGEYGSQGFDHKGFLTLAR